MPIRAAFFDFGGVILSSPFEAFNAFEERHGLPRDFIRTVNATNPDTNANTNTRKWFRRLSKNHGESQYEKWPFA